MSLKEKIRRKKLGLIAQEDQILAEMRQNIDQLKKIANKGVQTEEDNSLAKSVCSFLVGYLLFHYESEA